MKIYYHRNASSYGQNALKLNVLIGWVHNCLNQHMDDTTTNFSVICKFHDADKLGRFTVNRCRFILNNHDQWIHQVIFKEPMPKHSVLEQQSIGRIFDLHQYITGINEPMSNLVVSSLYDIDPSTSRPALYKILSDLISYCCSLTVHNIVDAVLLHDAKQFSKSVACITVTGNVTILNRFVMRQEKKHKILIKQFLRLLDVIKVVFYSSKVKKSSGGGNVDSKSVKRDTTINATIQCVNCKLKNEKERFLSFDYTELHNIFCGGFILPTDKIQSLHPFIMNDKTEEVYAVAVEKLINKT